MTGMSESEVQVDRGQFEMCPHWLLFHRDVSGTAIRLYLILRQHADTRGDSFPSRQRLADMLGISLPTLDKARATLIEIGALTMDRRQGSNGEWLSCLYRVHWEPHGGGQESWHPPVKNLTPPSQETCTLTKTHLSKTQDLISPSSEPSEPPSGAGLEPAPVMPEAAGKAATGRDRDAFDRFWRAYPRKVGKRAAQAAWTRAVRDADPEEIIAGAIRYAQDPNREDAYTAHAQTWLRAGRWEDPPLPARNARQATGGQRRMEAYADLAQKVGQRGITA